MMNQDVHVDDVINRYRSDPYTYLEVRAMHAGRVRFLVEAEAEVRGPSGEWKQVGGTALYEITRERNPKFCTSETNGTISTLRQELDGQFVESGEHLCTIRHPLAKKEIIEKILQEVLFLFPAPERARYYFALDVQAKLDKKGPKSVTISPGDEVIIMSLMKRDTPVYYDGPAGIIHSVYFKPGESVAQGTPLIGVCAPESLPLIQKIITRVKSEWE